ncbi:serine protease 27-like [Lepisosteus oculatus]|uniref:serine protease 27-like n=1 Tax=Lepisosteus oculatus TaxID=7918 RepID=UPI00371EEAF6
MKMFFLLAFFGILILNKEEVSSSPLSRSSIVGGQEAKEGAWPWQVYIQTQVNQNNATFCGGSLISKLWVLTAAHCFKPSFLLKHSFVRLGAYKLDQPSKHEVKKSIKKVVLHEQYKEKAADGFDIALVQLDSKVCLSPYISPVQLAKPNDVFTEDTECWVTGWGMTKENVPLAPPRTLQEVQLTIVDNRCCQIMYNSNATIREDMMCAGDEDGQKDTCKGDSGGPLLWKKGGSWIQAGIVSFGRDCGMPNSLGVYTRVSSFTDWIKKHSGV